MRAASVRQPISGSTPRRSSTAARARSIPEHRFSTRRLAIGQQYQFYRNVWVHPFVAAGLDLTWERQDRTDEIYWSLPSRVETHPTRTTLLARPFATAGLKAYFNSQAFFRTDMKLTFDRGVDEVLLRIGVGVDF